MQVFARMATLPMPRRHAAKVWALAGMAWFLLNTTLWVILSRTRMAGAIRRVALGTLLLSTGNRLIVHGAPTRSPGTLFVANHISWIDIAALAWVLDAGFVAKADVARWPVVGTLARKSGCLFIDRGSRRDASRMVQAIARFLDGGRSLVIFPEGTTSLGEQVLPFHSSLMPGGGSTVQPVTIRYRALDGSQLGPKEQRRVAWIDDDSLFGSLLGLLGTTGRRVELWFEQPIIATCRKEATDRCHAVITARLSQTASLKRAA